jgi:hypothetical protein
VTKCWAAGFTAQGERVTAWARYDRDGATLTVERGERNARIAEVRVVGLRGLLFRGETRPGGVYVSGGDTFAIPGPMLS